MIRLLTRVSTSSEYPDSDYEHGYVEIDEKLAKTLAGRFNLFDAARKSNPDLVSLTFTSSEAEFKFYKYAAFYNEEGFFFPSLFTGIPNADDELVEISKDSDFRGFSNRQAFDEEFQTTGLETVVLSICEGGAYWTAYTKHLFTELTSAVIPRDLLSKVI